MLGSTVSTSCLKTLDIVKHSSSEASNPLPDFRNQPPREFGEIRRPFTEQVETKRDEVAIIVGCESLGGRGTEPEDALLGVVDLVGKNDADFVSRFDVYEVLGVLRVVFRFERHTLHLAPDLQETVAPALFEKVEVLVDDPLKILV